MGEKEQMMFYRHLKKIALALTSFFWAGCDDSGSSAVCLYGPDPNYSSAAENLVSSSSEATKEIPSSSEMQQAIALYGVPADFKSITLCFNDMAKNEAGKEFKIIDCTDGNRYLRDPSDATGEGVVLPEGVDALAPEAGSDKAKNCESAQEVCIERNPNLDPDPLAGCFPTINCPEKPTEDE